MITFYDFASKLPERTFHPHAWKTRYTLNYKGVPYKTEWVEYPDIEGICKKMGIPPTTKKPDGSDRYTLPAIYDSSTGTGIADSLLIAAYLDKTYPDTPKVLPSGTAALQDAFVDAFMSKMGSAGKIFFPIMQKVLNKPGSDYLLRAVAQAAAAKEPPKDSLTAEEESEANWKSLKDAFSALDGWYQKNGGGPFIMGDTPSFGDFAVGGFLAFGKNVKDDIPEWKNVLQWNDGRWKKLSEALDKFE
ncbi:hypothetical protein BDQ12DRAFT_685440 [Crucibulum laeve]|uniref:GST N-terminal domain-containing protein n=1 Tax=Crucibulum laeve TaxID=68775 RepID=A0A5C3LWI7_9AGAR|nr:hypothetical protein BDQ12DRAFT_685440 [Crucibulum laeve]